MAIDIALGHRAALAHTATMPQLWCDLAALRMDRINDLFPAGKPLLSMKIGHVGIAIGCDVIRAGTFRNNEPDTPCRSTPVPPQRRGKAQPAAAR